MPIKRARNSKRAPRREPIHPSSPSGWTLVSRTSRSRRKSTLARSTAASGNKKSRGCLCGNLEVRWDLSRNNLDTVAPTASRLGVAFARSMPGAVLPLLGRPGEECPLPHCARPCHRVGRGHGGERAAGFAAACAAAAEQPSSGFIRVPNS